VNGRIVDFMVELRAAGVRISVAESIDALRALEAIGIADKNTFRAALRATLVKDSCDVPTFEELFLDCFRASVRPMPNKPGSSMLQQNREKLAQVLDQMLRNLTLEQLLLNTNPNPIRRLFEAMMTGQDVSCEEMQHMLRDFTSLSQLTNRYYYPWMSRQAMREMRFDRLDDLLQELLEKLRKAGISDQTLRLLAWEARENQQVLADLIRQEVSAYRRRLFSHHFGADASSSLEQMVRDMTIEQLLQNEMLQEARENQQVLGELIDPEVGTHIQLPPIEVHPSLPPIEVQLSLPSIKMQPLQPSIDELLDQPFDRLRLDEVDDMRGVINRLASQLRSRAALRLRRSNTGQLDAKATIRANQRFAGVPLDVRHKKKHLKPKLTVICDLSISMRPVAAFMLMLVYALQDQISRTRSYAFVADLYDISNDFNESRPDLALEAVQERIRPDNYNTDLGNTLGTFVRDHLSTIDRYTTVIVFGDGRNNYNDPNLHDFEAIKRRARRVVWFNPEHPRQWGTGDSDMPKYVPLCDAVHQVSNLRQLRDAVDSLFTHRL
jgi:uncharacterized protein